jgi:molybdopterin/thiamine biosynthesis adenylyltransferase
MDMLGPKNANGVHFRVQLLDGRFGAVWESFPVFPVEIRPSLDANAARDLSAIDPQEASFQGVLAGVGALGGTLADIWVRECWGHWTFIDPDQVLPHNLSRHIAVDSYVGYRKALVVQDIAKAIYPHESPPGAIVKSIVGEGEDISKALSAAQLVVDVTTTFEAPRGLALRDNVPRTVSLFMTPSGLSSVMIMEDTHRQQRVDALEGQYYRAILNNEWGASHLANHYGDRWVGGGCRDISVRMSNECIHLHAGILSRQLRQSAVKDDARLCVWTSDELSGAVAAHEVQLFAVTSVQTGGWTVKYDQGLVQKLKETRDFALPNETGGAILGVTDFKTRTIILVDVLPAPPDSEASPSHFIRGKQGQEDALEVVHRRTARVVDYVGEWHSHPPGCSARASAEDEKLLSSLHRKMSAEGLPAVMLIVSVDQINIVVR